MSSTEENLGKITNSSLDRKDDESCENVSDNVVRPICGEEEPLDAENDSDPLNPLASNAAQILPLLQNLLLGNEIQRERVLGLIELYDPVAEARNAVEGEQIATEADLLSKVHFLEQSVEKLKEEVENQKRANAELEEEISRLTKSSDPSKHD